MKHVLRTLRRPAPRSGAHAESRSLRVGGPAARRSSLERGAFTAVLGAVVALGWLVLETQASSPGRPALVEVSAAAVEPLLAAPSAPDRPARSESASAPRIVPDHQTLFRSVPEGPAIDAAAALLASVDQVEAPPVATADPHGAHDQPAITSAGDDDAGDELAVAADAAAPDEQPVMEPAEPDGADEQLAVTADDADEQVAATSADDTSHDPNVVEHTIATIPDPPDVGASGERRSFEVDPDQGDHDPWLGVRSCESHNNYAINTGNGFYGAYQFTISSWDWVAGLIGRPDLVGVRPDLAAPWDQDRMAQALAFEVNGGGLHHWPVCGRYYG